MLDRILGIIALVATFAVACTESSTPIAEPTSTPTAESTSTPTAEPAATPTPEPTATPTAEPTSTPTAEPTSTPAPESSQFSPQAIFGSGEATAAPYMTYIRHAGGISFIRSFGDPPFEDTVENRFTFAFHVTVDENGDIQGSMQIVDLDQSLATESDVETLRPHAVRSPPAGFEGVSYDMRSSIDSVIVNGEPKPGWRVRNSPVFDGGDGNASDTVCFELFDETDTKLIQWSAFLSGGNVQVVP